MAIEITVPRLGWSMEEGLFSAWLKKDGDRVKVGEPIFTLESEKAAQDVESLDAGILRIPPDAPKPGDTVVVGQLLAYLLAEGEALPSKNVSAVAPTPAMTAPVVSESKPHAPVHSRAITPRARRAAAETGVDVSAIQGTGRGGRIRERDVRKAASASSDATPPAIRAIPITTLRRTIAERMVQSLNTTAPVTMTCRADATALVALRQQLKATSGEAPPPSYTDIIAKLVAVALRSHPLLGARWEGDRIILPDAIHIGLAVETEHGLLVPVMRNVSELTLGEVARRARELIEAARARRLKSEDLQGGTFTITNLGSFGIEAFTPIINLPETAILGLGAIRRAAVALDDGSVTSREQLTLSLTFDHRIVDGAPAARFLQTLRQGIEAPGVVA